TRRFVGVVGFVRSARAASAGAARVATRIPRTATPPAFMRALLLGTQLPRVWRGRGNRRAATRARADNALAQGAPWTCFCDRKRLPPAKRRRRTDRSQPRG